MAAVIDEINEINKQGLRPLVVVAGPTASGKSALAVHLARRFGGEVLCCDSAQIYRGFDIGTGKVTPAEAGGIPHHLTDLCDPGERFTAGDYMREGRKVLAGLSERGRLPIITAGTGLYLRALLEGLAPLPQRSEALRDRLQARAEERGFAYLHAMLSRIDPPSAREIAPRDGSKLIRALEICFLARKPRSEFFREGRVALDGYRVLKLVLGPAKDSLYRRIESRIDAMMAAGWLDEVRRLMETCPAESKPLGFLGYKQLAAHLRGECTLDEAVAQTRHQTRQYARRQLTWFRGETGAEWLAGFGDEADIQNGAEARLRQFVA